MGHKNHPLKIERHPLAERQLEDAALTYQNESPQLLIKFARAVRKVEARIALFPRAAPMWKGDPLHRVPRLRGFPYKLPYILRENRAIILAIAHVRRRPGYWTSRLSVRSPDKIK